MKQEDNERLIRELREENYALRGEISKFVVAFTQVIHECRVGVEELRDAKATVKRIYQLSYNTMLYYKAPAHTKTPTPTLTSTVTSTKEAPKASKPLKPYKPFVPEIEPRVVVDNHGNTEVYRTYKATMIRESDQKMKKLTADTEDELFDMIDYWEQHGFTLYGRVTVKEDEDKIAGDVDFGC